MYGFPFTLKLKIVSFQFSFFTNFLNIIDLFGILPFFISVFLNTLNSQYSLEWMAKAAQIFRILRMSTFLDDRIASGYFVSFYFDLLYEY